MLTKFQIGFCILAGLGIVVFGVAMITNVNVPILPRWLGPVAWSSFGVMVACCLGVVVTLILDRDKPPKPADESKPDEEEPEPEPAEGLLPEQEEAEHGEIEHGETQHEVAELGEAEQTIADHLEPAEEEDETMFHAGDSESFEIKTE